MSKTIREILDHSPVSRLMMEDASYVQEGPTVASPGTIIGLELEIEGWNGRGTERRGFHFTTDGSLRNGGIEAVTHPTRTKFVYSLLTRFFDHFEVTDENYSERCSTHVHMNVLDFTIEQVAGLALIYQVVERLLFKYVEDSRKSSIFCVPWCQADSKVNLVDVITTGKWRSLKQWSKYTALNLLAITERGTVEYRHLEGTCDVTRIMGWVNILGCIHNAAKEKSLQEIKDNIMELNTSSAYEQFMRGVFKDYTSLLIDFSTGYSIELEQGVMDAKLMLMKSVTAEVNAVEPEFAPQLMTLEQRVENMRILRDMDNRRTWAAVTGEAPPPPPWPARAPDVLIMDELLDEPDYSEDDDE